MRQMKTILAAVAVACSCGSAICAAVPHMALELAPTPDSQRKSEGDFIRLRNGDILYVYSHFTTGFSDFAPGDIRSVVSHDGGMTWSKQTELVASGRGGNIMSASLIRLNDGRIAVFYGRKSGTTPGRSSVFMSVSADEGRTWSAERDILPGSYGHGYSAQNNSRVVRLSSGRIVLPLMRHTDPSGKQDWAGGQHFCILSDDDGRTWRMNKDAFRRTYDRKGEVVRTQEPGVVELKDGRVLMYVRTNRGRQWFYYSSDGCETWTAGEPGNLFGPLSPATIKRLSNGDLVAIWNDHEPTPWLGDIGPTQLYGLRTPLTLAISQDEGKTWKLRHNLESDRNGCYCYFGLLENDGNLLLSYCATGLETSRIAVVPLEWLYAPAHERPPRISRKSLYEMDKEGPFEKHVSVHGTWTAPPGAAAIRRWHEFKGVWLEPGAKGEVVLSLRKPAKSKTLRLSVVRTSDAPFDLFGEALTTNGEWKSVCHSGAKTPVGKMSLIDFTSLSPMRVKAYRFRLESSAGAVLTALTDGDFFVDSFFAAEAERNGAKKRGDARGVPSPVGQTGPRFVAFGSEFARIGPREIAARAAEFDKTALDGVGVLCTFEDASGAACGARSIMETGPWTRESADRILPYLKEFRKHRSLKGSMLSSFRHPERRIPWDDDASWNRVASNMRTLARLARESGLPGLYADEEDYLRQRQFTAAPTDGKDFDSVAALARRRGREVFKAVFDEYPQVQILFFRLMTSGRGFWSIYYDAPDPLAEMRRAGDLWPSFVNGILDAIPPDAVLFDGDESSYYYEGDTGDFYRAYMNVRGRLSRLVAPENLAKFRAQVRVSSSVYLDMYAAADEKSKFYREPVNGSRAAHLERNLNRAAEVAEGLVWFWGEKRAWVDWGKTPIKSSVLRDATWNEAAPGLDAAMRFLRDPLAEGIGRMDAMGAVSNLVAGLPLEEYGKWQRGKSKNKRFDCRQGTFGTENGMLWSEGVEDGCYVVFQNGLCEGDRYAVRLEAKGRDPGGVVTFRKGGKRRRFEILPAVPLLSTGKGADGWETLVASVRIPEGMDGFDLSFTAKEEAGERAWFRNLEIVRVHSPREAGLSLGK